MVHPGMFPARYLLITDQPAFVNGTLIFFDGKNSLYKTYERTIFSLMVK